jgi:hypothetical protein
MSSFGRALSPDCQAHYDGNLTTPCSLSYNILNITDLVGAPEAYKTVNNISAINQIITASPADSDRTYVFLGDARVPANVDFVASTVAINTQCKPITQTCDHEVSNVELVLPDGPAGFYRLGRRAVSIGTTPWQSVTIAGALSFNCSTGFNQNLTNFTAIPIINWTMRFFNDPAMTLPASISAPANPIYFGIVAIINSNGNTTSYPLYKDPDVFHGNATASAVFDGFILGCNATVYDATYTWLNGSLQNFTVLTRANASAAGTLNSLFQGSSIGVNQLTNGASLAGFSNSSQVVADKMALVYSQTNLGYASGVFTSRRNEREWTRETVLLARVPFAPFYTLVLLNVLYALIALILTVVAVRINAHEQDVNNVRQCLSTEGLVAFAFGEENQKMNYLKDNSHGGAATDSIVVIDE